MAYTHKIPATLAGAEMLQEHISKNINIENLAHAFSMTGMSLTEVLDLHDCISSTMMPLRRAYREIEEYSQHFLDQFTTNNNDYHFMRRNVCRNSQVRYGHTRKCSLHSYLHTNGVESK